MTKDRLHKHGNCGWEQIFVLCLPRSGSTLLRLLLDTHPAISCPGELYLGRLAEDLYHSLYYSIGQLLEGDETERTSWITQHVRADIEKFMKPYTEAKGKLIWAEKTPANLAHADLLRRTFPGAAFLCLHRHPLDLIRSGFESTRFGKLKFDLWDYQSGCDFCIEQTRALLDFEKANPARCFRLRYEDIVKDATTVLSRAFDFLGLEPAPTIATAVFSTKHESGPGDPKAEFASRIYGTSIGKGAEIVSLLAEVSPSTKKKLEQLIAELGYPPIDLSSSDQENWSQAVDSAVFGSPNVASVEELFQVHFPAKLQQRSGLKGSVKFLVKGSGGGTWTLNFAQRPVSIRPMNEEADCTITIRSEDLIKLATGELNVGECYLQAKLRIAGNEAIAVSLGRALFS